MRKLRLCETKNIALIGIMAATLEVAKLALSFLPNIEIVSLLIFVFAGVFRKRVFFSIYIFVVLEYCFWGFGLWSISYLYVWTIIGLIGVLFKAELSPVVSAILLGIFGLCFGLFCLGPDLIIGGPVLAATRFVSGIPFDLLHCGGNFITGLLLYKPIYCLFKKLNHNYFSETSSL